MSDSSLYRYNLTCFSLVLSYFSWAFCYIYSKCITTLRAAVSLFFLYPALSSTDRTVTMKRFHYLPFNSFIFDSFAVVTLISELLQFPQVQLGSLISSPVTNPHSEHSPTATVSSPILIFCGSFYTWFWPVISLPVKNYQVPFYTHSSKF